jgi:Cu(I)/Ag(I) efflux system membrane fusion protein
MYVQYCPMADNDKGGFWLSTEKQVINPYFGDMMLKCGEVTDSIK